MAFSIEELLAETDSVYDISIAVLLSAYNGEKYIEDQLFSVLDQDASADITIFVRDDGSEDGTVAVVEKMAADHGSIKLIKGEHIGRTASYFALLREAQGFTYYALCDQDDYWLPRKLQDAVTAIEGANETDLRPLLFCSRSALADESLTPIGVETPKAGKEVSFLQLLAQDLLPWHNMVMNEAMHSLLLSESDDVLEEVGDPSAWLAALAAVKGRIIFSNRLHTFCRQEKSGMQAMLFSVELSGRKERLEVLHYFCDVHADDIDEKTLKEAQAFFNAKSFGERLAFIRNTKIKAVTKADTRRFKLHYLFRGI